MTEDAGDFNSQDYLESVAQTLKQCTDSHGDPIGEFLPTEFAALTEFLLKIVEFRGAPWRYALELGAGARKHVPVFAGFLAVIAADARRLGRSILFLAVDSNSDAHARLEYRAMWPFTSSTKVEFATWDDLQPKPENGFRLADLSRFWVIGDLDWTGQAMGGENAERKIAAVQRVLADGACPALLLHQQGKTPIMPFPPAFGAQPAGKSSCFIATAACGSPLAEEVETLREFRDRLLVHNVMGAAVVAVYERFSPRLARWLEFHPAIRSMVRNIIIRPLARLLG